MTRERFERLLLIAVAAPAVVVAILTGASGLSAFLFDVR